MWGIDGVTGRYSRVGTDADADAINDRQNATTRGIYDKRDVRWSVGGTGGAGGDGEKRRKCDGRGKKLYSIHSGDGNFSPLFPGRFPVRTRIATYDWSDDLNRKGYDTI
jgi:hypothetical protein